MVGPMRGNDSNKNGWTFKTLLDHIVAMMDANDRRYLDLFQSADKATAIAMTAAEKAVNAALSASDKAVGKAEESQIRVNVGQNEFRAQLKDQAATFVTRIELVGVHNEITSNFERGQQALKQHADTESQTHEQHETRLKGLETFRANFEGRFWALGVGMGIFVVVVNWALRFLK
jgi:hypothetical protein